MPINDNGVYEGIIPIENEDVGGLQSVTSRKKRDPGFLQAGRESWKHNNEAPWQQPLRNIVGPTDYGNSKYDVQGESITEVENLEDTRSKAQPFIDKFGVGLATFIGKTATATIGGTIGMVNGIVQGIAEER